MGKGLEKEQYEEFGKQMYDYHIKRMEFNSLIATIIGGGLALVGVVVVLSGLAMVIAGNASLEVWILFLFGLGMVVVGVGLYLIVALLKQIFYKGIKDMKKSK